MVVRLYQALTVRYPGIGWEEFGELTLGEFGGLVGLDRVDAADDPDVARAQRELERKRGPSPKRKG